MKKILSLLLVLAVMLTLVPFAFAAETAGEEAAAAAQETAGLPSAEETVEITSEIRWIKDENIPLAVGDHVLSEVENNNTLQRGTYIVNDSTVVGYLDPFDIDCFQFSTTELSSDVTIVCASDRGSVAFNLYDGAYRFIGSSVEMGWQDGFHLDALGGVLLSDSYYLEILDVEGRPSEYLFYLQFEHVHRYDTPVVCPPTCIAEGYTEHYCVCGNSYRDSYVPEADHTYVGYSDNGDGTATAYCEVCGEAPYTKAYAGDAKVKRIFGQTRYDTSFKIANEYKAVLGAEKFESIIIASGVNFPDALAGSYLAAKKNAPILMAKVADGQLQNADQLKAYIDANLVPVGQIYVLGGPTAIPTTLEDALSGLSVKRLQGDSRYDTNIEILKEAGITGDTLLVCTGKDYADALSASASGLPILLIDGKSEGVLRDAQKDFLEQYDFSKIYILGGPVAVNEAYDGVLGGYADTVKRLAGINRRATSVLVAETFFTAPDAAVLAYSKNFPDGLCGGPLANALGAPILLTETANPTETGNYTHNASVKAGYVLGGSGLISNTAAAGIFAAEMLLIQ